MPLCQRFADACGDYTANWKLLDDTLYSLCAGNPRHNTSLVVNAKVQIVGLSYQTGIQRHVAVDAGHDPQQGAAIRKVAGRLVEQWERIETIFKELRNLTPSLDADKLLIIVGLHARFVELLRPVLRENHLARSFAAKYMHFHCRTVPIFDGDAETFLAANGLVPPLEIRGAVGGADEQYFLYARRFLNLYSRLRECPNLDVTVKTADHFINYVGELHDPEKIQAIEEIREACALPAVDHD